MPHHDHQALEGNVLVAPSVTPSGLPPCDVKDLQGRFFEDFSAGQVIRHGTPRTVTDGDVSVYIALTGLRQAAQSSVVAAAYVGLHQRPLADFLVFNIAFGKTVPDISLNAVANLGYAQGRFLAPVFVGDTLRCESVVLSVKENSNGKTGVVYVQSRCYNQNEKLVLSWIRWVMVHRRVRRPETLRDVEPSPPTHLPQAGEGSCQRFSSPTCGSGWAGEDAPDPLAPYPRLASRSALDAWCQVTGSARLWEHYAVGERINHPAGMTLEEADHMLATRLYQNNARVHFNARTMRDSPTGRRLVYGGHVISVCQALAHDGLENVIAVAAIHAGTHAAPTVAGDTLYAFTQVLETFPLPGRVDVGALRLRLVGLKNLCPADVDAPHVARADAKVSYHPNVVLDLDYTVWMPRKR